ncbi:hypothetical protein VB773_14565 [Haloarculaceae archaeon H-GB2-1]|nr:hypothetical protein [Haloarculaceae archaeon H-GB11]MEA5408671.1 hypothetical protein [Haloarculaceae archaeon H-GB2-1]
MPVVLVLVVGLAAGVAIDVDHFVVARYRDGDWNVLEKLVENPLRPFTDPEALFVETDLDGLDRLVSHAAIGGVVVPLLALSSTYLAVVAAVSLYVHVLADLVNTRRGAVVYERDEIPPELREKSD